MYFPNKLTEEILIDQCRWEAKLTNGEMVYDDLAIPIAWQRLKEYCEENNLGVCGLTIGFRDITVAMPHNKSGYFFRRMDRKNVLSEETKELFLPGYIEDNELIVKKYKMPEVELEETESRAIKDYLESIIWNEKQERTV